MARIPSLGSRGEGWVILQMVCLGAIGLGGLTAGTTVTAPLEALAATVGAALIAGGTILGLAGLVALNGGDALTALPHPRDAATLVESGPYRLVRHPIYGALVIGSAGWAILRLSAVAAIATMALFVILDLKRRREEGWLVDRFPGYPAYRARTRRFIPWIW